MYIYSSKFPFSKMIETFTKPMSWKIKLFTNFFWNKNSLGKTGLLNKHWLKQTFSAQINYAKKIIETDNKMVMEWIFNVTTYPITDFLGLHIDGSQKKLGSHTPMHMFGLSSRID